MATFSYLVAALLACAAVHYGMTAAVESRERGEMGLEATWYASLSVFLLLVAGVIGALTWWLA